MPGPPCFNRASGDSRVSRSAVGTFLLGRLVERSLVGAAHYKIVGREAEPVPRMLGRRATSRNSTVLPASEVPKLTVVEVMALPSPTHAGSPATTLSRTPLNAGVTAAPTVATFTQAQSSPLISTVAPSVGVPSYGKSTNWSNETENASLPTLILPEVR